MANTSSQVPALDESKKPTLRDFRRGEKKTPVEGTVVTMDQLIKGGK